MTQEFWNKMQRLECQRYHVNHPVCHRFIQIFNYILVFAHRYFRHDSQTKKELRQKPLESSQSRKPKKTDVWQCITGRAMLKDDICPMKLHVYMLHNNEWYLHCHSCLTHCTILLYQQKPKQSPPWICLLVASHW